MIEKFTCIYADIRMKVPKSEKSIFDEEWDVRWSDDGSLGFSRQINHSWALAGTNRITNSSPAPLDPQDVIALLRELADEIECEMEAQEDYQAEFEERAAILEHDGNMTSEQAETQAGAETLG